MYIFLRALYMALLNYVTAQQVYDYTSQFYTTTPPPFLPATTAYQTPPPPDPLTTTSTTLPPIPEKIPFIPKLITYWGQNVASKVLGTSETGLANLCTQRSPYSSIIIGYVDKFSDHDNLDELPGMTFTIHCTKSISDKYRSLLYCPEIANDIRICHERGIKILIGIGGPNSPSHHFENELKAEKFAKEIWNLFLGGDEMPDLRPFGSVVLDGINMFMEAQTKSIHHDHIFLMTLHNLRKTDLSRNFLITLSPSCLFPDPYFGPGVGKILQDSINIIDQIYVRYTNSKCCMKGSYGFQTSINKWKNFISSPALRGVKTPDLFVGVPATLTSAVTDSCYRSPKEMMTVLHSMRICSKFRGFAVIDNAFDIQDLKTGFTFSKELLKIAMPPHYQDLPKYKPIFVVDNNPDTMLDHSNIKNISLPDDIHQPNDQLLEDEAGHETSVELPEDKAGHETDDKLSEEDTEHQLTDELPEKNTADEVYNDEDKEAHSVFDVHLTKPTQPITILATSTETPIANYEILLKQKLYNHNHGITTVSPQHTDDDLMTIEAENHENKYGAHHPDSIDTSSNHVLDDTDKYQDDTSEDVENEPIINVHQTQDEEKNIPDFRGPPKNDPLLNSIPITGETPNGKTVDNELNVPSEPSHYNVNADQSNNNHVSSDEIHSQSPHKTPHKTLDLKYATSLFQKHPDILQQVLREQLSKKQLPYDVKKTKTKNHTSDPSQDFIIPFIHKNLPNVAVKNIQQHKKHENFHKSRANHNDVLIPFFDRNLPTISPTAISGKKNQKSKKFHNVSTGVCEDCLKRFFKKCTCLKTLSSTQCKQCRTKLEKKCKLICKKFNSLLSKIDHVFNSTLENFLSNKFKNNSNILKQKDLKNLKHIESASSKNFENNSNNIIEKQKTKETSSRLNSLKFYHVPEMFRTNYKSSAAIFTNVKLHPLKIEQDVGKLKFDQLPNEVKNTDHDTHKADTVKETRIAAGLNLDRVPYHNSFLVSNKKHKMIMMSTKNETTPKNKSRIQEKDILRKALLVTTNLIKEKRKKQRLLQNNGREKLKAIKNFTTTLEPTNQWQGSGSGNFNEIPRMYDDIKNFIVDDMMHDDKKKMAQVASGEEIEYLYDSDPLTAIYDEDPSGSGDPYEEDVVYFYPDGRIHLNNSKNKQTEIQKFAAVKNNDNDDPSTFWSNDYDHRIPNVADAIKQVSLVSNRSPDNEFKIPNVFNPLNSPNPPMQHGAQMEENSKYLKMLQNDIQRQINIFNQDIIEEQPASPDDVDTNSTKPYSLPDEELQKLVEYKDANIFENNAATNELIEHENSEKYDVVPNADVSNYVIPKNELKHLIDYSYNNKKGFLNFKDYNLPTENSIEKDLISNVNVKGNMSQLKALMTEMQKNIDDANTAMQDKQMQDQNEIDEKERENEDSEDS